MPRGPIEPPEQFQDMRFPLAGVDRTMGFDRQPVRQLVNGDFARTTVSARNVRSFDPATDRARGGSRPGIARYATNQVNSSASIQDLNYISVPGLIPGGSGTVPGWGIATAHIFRRMFDRVELCHGTPTAAWSVPTTSFGTPAITGRGNNAGSTCFTIWAYQNAAGSADTVFWQIHKNGTLVATSTIPGNPSARSISVTTDGTDFYAVWQNAGTITPAAGTIGAISVSNTGTVNWSNSNVGSATNNAPNHTSATVIISGVLYTLFHGTGVYAITAATGVAVGVEVTGNQIINATGGLFRIQQNQESSVNRPFGYMSNVGNLLAIACESTALLNYRRAVVFYNVATNAFSPSYIGASSLTDADGLQQTNRASNFLTLDTDGTNFYALLGNRETGILTNDSFVVKINATTGARTWGSDRPGGLEGNNLLQMFYSSSLTTLFTSGPGASWALDPSTGDIKEESGLGSGILGAFDAGLVNDDNGQFADDGSTVGGFNRALCLTAVAGGTMKVWFQGVWRPVLAGGGSLSSTSKVIRSAVNGGILYLVDDTGTNYTKYNPTSNSLLAWTATAGSLPVDSFGKKARLICTWRGRTILSGLPNDPNNIFASKQNDSTGFFYSPPSPAATDAWALNAAGIGQIPDVVTALIPYSDDYLFVGCDHEIWRISGDPRAGGKLDMVSRQLGVAWGKAWCTDPSGNLYIFSNQCGVYTLSPNEQPLRISQAIDPILREIDLRKAVINLAWNDRQQGMHVWVTRISGAQPEIHYFWDQRTGAWWPDSFDDDDHNPLCTLTFQGNTGSGRVVTIGSFDGYVRFVSDNAPNDDGVNILSEVWNGPLLSKDGEELLLKDTQWNLGKDSAPVTYAIHVGDTAERAFFSEARETGTIGSGRSTTIPTRWAGHAIYQRMQATGQWTCETSRSRLAATGMVRQRRGP